MQNIKNLFFLAILISILPFSSAKSAPLSSTKETSTSSGLASTDVSLKKAADEALASFKTANQADKLARLLTLGAKLIDARVASLNKISGNLPSLKLSADQTNVLTALIKTNVDGLTILKAKIAADSTLETAKTDVKSIYDKYHVYAVLLPKLHLTISLYQIESSITSLSSASTRMQKAIDAKTDSSEESVLISALADFSKQYKDASADAESAKESIAKMIQTDKASSISAATTARSHLTKARASLVAIRGDLLSFKTALAHSTSGASVAPSTTQGTKK